MQSAARSFITALVFAGLPAVAGAQTNAAPLPLTIGGAARLAAEHGTTAVTARERAAQRAAQSVQTRADLLPTLTSDAVIDGGTNPTISTGLGGPGGGIGTIPIADRTVDMRVRVSQTLFDPAALRRWRASSADADAAELSADHSANLAAEDGALAYLKVLRAEARLQARIADSTLAWELLDIARQHLSAGTAIALDVTRAESQLASATSALIRQRNERARVELDMLRVLGLSIETAVRLTDSLRAPVPGDRGVLEADAVRGALSRRGDVQSAQLSILAAHRSIGAARLERLPSISAFAQASSTTDGALDSHTYGIQVSVPVFDGLRREGRIREAQAREREATAQYEDARRRTEVEVRSSLLDLDAARQQVEAARVQVSLAEREVTEARDRFTNGVAGNADVINAQLSLNGARDVMVDALTSYHTARVNLASAQGETVGLP
jgi:outer membrane protein TolC